MWVGIEMESVGGNRGEEYMGGMEFVMESVGVTGDMECG